MKILEIGVGEGGPHLDKKNHQNDSYYVLDNSNEFTRTIMEKYPKVQIIPPDHRLKDFPTSLFDQIEIRFPFNSLLVPGLQKKAQDLYDINDQLERYCPSTENGIFYYPELSRILHPEKKLIIWGDDFVNTAEIISNADPHFRLHLVEMLNIDDLKIIDTYCARKTRRAMLLDLLYGITPPKPKKITLHNNKS